MKLAAKHPVSDEPPFVPDAEGDSAAVKLNSEFNLRGVLASFARDVGTDGTNFRVQHLVDGCNSHLPRSVLSSLRHVINLLLSGQVLEDVRPFLSGAKLTALAKGESDIRPIAAGNVFRRIASKCVCQLNQARFRTTLGKLQVGVACPAGAESVVHLTRDIVDRHWSNSDFVLLKVDFANAFNAIDRHALLLQCRQLLPDLLPWVRWCYGGQPLLFHPTGNLRSCVGVQQGDPLGPLLFCLVLRILTARIHEACPGLDLHRWYLDDGVIAGSASDVLRALSILRAEGPALGLRLNLGKCELFSSEIGNFDWELHSSVVHRFPPELHQRSDVPNFVLLGSPIGDIDFCSDHVQGLCRANRTLLDRLPKLEDPQAALHLLRTCASFSKFVYVARTTPPDLVRQSLAQCDDDVRDSFATLAALQLSDRAWCQAQLSLSKGGLGLRSVAEHCAVAYICSHIRALPDIVSSHLGNAVNMFAYQVKRPVGVVEVEELMASPPSQRVLSAELDRIRAASLLDGCSLVDQLRLRSCAAPRASAWLLALPCRGPLDLTLEADQMRAALQHRLGLPLAEALERCSYCSKYLDVAGHHHVTCSHGSFVTPRHNKLRDGLFSLCAAAGMSPSTEEGSFEHDRTRPADVLVPSWKLGRSAAFDLTVVSPLIHENIHGAGGSIDVVSRAALVKHAENDDKCSALGWLCVPLAVDSYGQWCDEAHNAFMEIAIRLSNRTKVTVSRALSSIFNTLGVFLARHNAIALLARRAHPFAIGAREVLSSSSHLR